MTVYFTADGTLVIEADTPIEAFALKQWAKSRESDATPDGFALLLKFDTVRTVAGVP